MFKRNYLLFSQPLQECLQSSHKAKFHWLKSVQITVQDAQQARHHLRNQKQAQMGINTRYILAR
eukprot:1023170-Ditylum_brightwellii.AAC.1